jgi:Uma2 family endonuclease
MATVPKQQRTREIEYPSGDGKPVAETGPHVRELLGTIQLLDDHFAGRPDVFVGGNMFLYYVEGNRRKHLAPDIMVTISIPKEPPRDYYLVWEEGKAPNFIVEITSKSTRHEDRKKKFVLYRDVLRVSEYFLFDLKAEYLDPPLQGFRLIGGEYVPIEPVAGRLPSQVLSLHLERDGENLRLFDPATGKRLLTRLEARDAAERRAVEEREHAQAAERRAVEEREHAQAAERRAVEERQRAQAAETERQSLAEENERLRREIEALRGG